MRPINQLLYSVASILNDVTELRPETAFELPSKLLLAGSFYNNIIKNYVVLVLILIEINLERFLAYPIYC